MWPRVGDPWIRRSRVVRTSRRPVLMNTACFVRAGGFYLITVYSAVIILDISIILTGMFLPFSILGFILEILACDDRPVSFIPV